MSVLPLRIIGDPILRTPAQPVRTIDSTIENLISNMFDTMDDAGGIGLAANQVGVGLQVFTYDVDGVRGVVVNPELDTSGDPSFTYHPGSASTEASSEPEGETSPTNNKGAQEELPLREGCLSVPEIFGPVLRPQHAILRGLDLTGRPVEVSAEGLLAVCFQHEMDHLHGKLFLDRLRGTEKKNALQALRSAE